MIMRPVTVTVARTGSPSRTLASFNCKFAGRPAGGRPGPIRDQPLSGPANPVPVTSLSECQSD
jgi:hypothetical protein